MMCVCNVCVCVGGGGILTTRCVVQLVCVRDVYVCERKANIWGTHIHTYIIETQTMVLCKQLGLQEKGSIYTHKSHIYTNTLQHTATHCNTLQHTATHCNTLQHTATHYPNSIYTLIPEEQAMVLRELLSLQKEMCIHPKEPHVHMIDTLVH